MSLQWNSTLQHAFPWICCVLSEKESKRATHHVNLNAMLDRVHCASAMYISAQRTQCGHIRTFEHVLTGLVNTIRQQRHPTIEDDIGDSRRDEIRQSAADRSQLTSSGSTCRHMRQPYRRDVTAGTWLSAADGKARMANQTIRISNKRMSCRLIKN